MMNVMVFAFDRFFVVIFFHALDAWITVVSFRASTQGTAQFLFQTSLFSLSVNIFFRHSSDHTKEFFPLKFCFNYFSSK